ncbi:hypothetical protein [Leadbetterella byssophila]|uniref:hypothetical protein n=1 Tax=Leadbetterella byssophila TaxID=316068 RepID=UPI0039A2AFE1
MKFNLKIYLSALLFLSSCASKKEPEPQGTQFVDMSELVTQWDDGWVSRIKEHWTEVEKGNMKVLIYHPHSLADAYQSNLDQGNSDAADLLEAPYFSDFTSVQSRGIQSFESITFITADAIEKENGKPVHLVFFKKHYNSGIGRYLLVVADSKASFEREFGKNYINSSSWDYMDQMASWTKLANMQFRNRFGLHAEILQGTWSSGSTSTLSYYYANGGYAGATGAAVADEFKFFSNQKYESVHSGASGIIGNMQFSKAEYKGNYSIQNWWGLKLTNRFEGTTEDFDGYFEAISKGLLLVLIDKHQTVTTLAKH